MKPEMQSWHLLKITRSKAKMNEFAIPTIHHIELPDDPAKLFSLSIGMLGDLAYAINEEVDKDLEIMKYNLLFSAHFFDSYFQSKLDDSLRHYLNLLGSATYYLCDLPGSSSVLANKIDLDTLDIEGCGLEKLLLWLLQDISKNMVFEINEGKYVRLIRNIAENTKSYWKNGKRKVSLIESADKLRECVYEIGTPRLLLFGDLVAAIIRKKIENSTWQSLPDYSGIDSALWEPIIEEEKFVKELWPAQHLLGNGGLFKGESAIVQMPTSAGKTKATEIIIRSAILSERESNLIIIVAPFKALCHEISYNLVKAFNGEEIDINEIADSLQIDFDLNELTSGQQILVLTPEKLLFVLRHHHELLSSINLLIFDEGHQFDSGERGITYELLLTYLRIFISKNVQKILISAVISNGEAVGEWLNKDPKVIGGRNLLPVKKSIGFISWKSELGMIDYLEIKKNSKEKYEKEFFVPRVIIKEKIEKVGRERKDRFFPEEGDPQLIALYLGRLLVKNGGIAIFCGRKNSVVGICEKVNCLIKRGVTFEPVLKKSDIQEIEKLKNLYDLNLGAGCPMSKCAKIGIFSHHGNTPHGIRVALEYAMREDMVHFVVCTSTLAQGVNLPIRYLLVSSLRQGRKYISVRDFQNLIGRVGRAGKYTEGSIIFTDSNMYDNRNLKYTKYERNWEHTIKCLDPENTEPCDSNLLSLFHPIEISPNKKIAIDIIDIVKLYIYERGDIENYINEHYDIKEYVSKENIEKGTDNLYNLLKFDILEKLKVIDAIESFLFSLWDIFEDGISEELIINIAKETLSYKLAEEVNQTNICDLFLLLANNISQKFDEQGKRTIYGKMNFGALQASRFNEWAVLNKERIISSKNRTELTKLVWPLFCEQIRSKYFSDEELMQVFRKVTKLWIKGYPYCDILLYLRYKIKKNNLKRNFQIDQVVEFCESTLAFEGSNLIGAICEYIPIFDIENNNEIINRYKLFQKIMKYGLPSIVPIILYELGFSDRIVSQKISNNIHFMSETKQGIIGEICINKEYITEVISDYPSYFLDRLNTLTIA